MKRLEMTDEEIMPGFLRASDQKWDQLTNTTNSVCLLP